METGATRGDNACGDGAAMLARLGGSTGGERDGGEDERAGIVSSERDRVDDCDKDTGQTTRVKDCGCGLDPLQLLPVTATSRYSYISPVI